MDYDIIGDIHGHADALEQLLQKLGYRKQGDIYEHRDNRKVVFLGALQDLYVFKNFYDFTGPRSCASLKRLCTKLY